MAENKNILEQLADQMAAQGEEEKEHIAFKEQLDINALSLDITLPQVKEICKKYLYMPDDNIIDFVLAVYISNFTEGERLWTWFIGPPSVGKTEILRALFSDASILKDSISAKTLFSGLRIGGKDPSLFKRINGKILLIKDFTKILSGRPEDLSAILGQLRNAYDGYFDAATGASDKDEHYETNFTLIAGVTPAIDDHYSVSQTLGERFLTWRIIDIDRAKFTAKIKENKGRKIQMRRDLKVNLGAFIKKYRVKKERPSIDDFMTDKIGELADIATWIRTPVMRFGMTKEIRRVPEREGPARLQEQLFHLGESLAFVREKNKVTESEYALLYKVAFNSVLPERIRAIELFLKITEAIKKEDFVESEFWTPTPEISDRLNLPTSTARIILDDLFLLKVLKRQGDNPLSWRLNSEFAARWEEIKKP